ncbi:MAG: XisH family protein [Gemmataceae bacterium]|nr:XisH family protein [Gemmataceae bacterium]
MAAKDAIKDAVVAALKKDGWTITDDPLRLDYAEFEPEIDLGAERLLAAERGVERIAVEVKTFAGPSRVREFRDALGQYEVYRLMLRDLHPDRKLYLAVSERGYARIFETEAVRRLTAGRPIPLVIVSVDAEEVRRWIE